MEETNSQGKSSNDSEKTKHKHKSNDGSRQRRYYEDTEDIVERVKRARKAFDRKILEMGDPKNYDVSYINPKPGQGPEFVLPPNPDDDTEQGKKNR